MYIERDSRKQVLGKAENTGELEYLSRCLEMLISTLVDSVPRLSSMSFLFITCTPAVSRYCFWRHLCVCLCVCPHKISKTTDQKLM